MDFIAVVDIILNDTAWFADVVLPEASYLERYDPLLPITMPAATSSYARRCSAAGRRNASPAATVSSSASR